MSAGVWINLDTLIAAQSEIRFVDVDALGVRTMGKVPPPVSDESKFWVHFGSKNCGIDLDFRLGDWRAFVAMVDGFLAGVEAERAEGARVYRERAAARADRAAAVSQ